ncbi:MAG: 2-oxoacid:ferredoxin oxidoreductase subunit beta [Planctomycetota bacterium]|nr:MAG: 2-oxoacid:ferredoxin oxidoreductase subunit beta [Planctomycetota bacterium]
MTTVEAPSYKKADFVSDQEVRWCPGCGDYAILNAVQQTFAKLGVSKEKFVCVSGIGCSSRFPYYADTFGFHSIHGRAPAVATGIKVANPDLSVWIITGDGDALSIGGNHIIHAMRRNLDMNVLLFNNRIYGLTKGQYSPTSEINKKTPSSPFGSVDQPFNPIALALGSGATFVARSVDTQAAHLKGVLEAAHAHKGFSFVEILQNCVIYNNKAFEHITDKTIRHDRQVDLQAGKPMVYGKDLDKGLKILPDSIINCPPEEASTWRTDGPAGANAFRICQASESGEIPVPFGILRQVNRPVFETDLHLQIQATTQNLGQGTLENLLMEGETWQVS